VSPSRNPEKGVTVVTSAGKCVTVVTSAGKSATGANRGKPVLSAGNDVGRAKREKASVSRIKRSFCFAELQIGWK